ncbi:histidine phosphatase superfamily [Dichotomopilus funicola]|uniref:Histidine phosphatase superfamily n=1 Tax=Dichotomopilus funicola TaxID=1934379 RepID=A0AAN6V381_9PEZI|nr:histidine phosphatase superfamily [Dichotomopilus funicola]
MTTLSTVLVLLVSSVFARPDNEHVIDNSQLHIESSVDRCSSASALAFMQGAYPPIPHVSCDTDVPSHNWLADGTVINYPMCGYQYPNIRTTVPERDSDSIWSNGHESCTKLDKSLLMFSNNSVADSIYENTKEFYSKLFDGVFNEAFPRSQANFFNAHELSDYAQYRRNHESGFTSSVRSEDLDLLRHLAAQEQFLKYGHLGKTPSDLTSAIAGRTLASRTVALFAENIESRGTRNKLNLAFASHEPFLGFFALAQLTTGSSANLFSRLPEAGATLTFELFSVDSEDIDDASPCDSPDCLREATCDGTGSCDNAPGIVTAGVSRITRRGRGRKNRRDNSNPAFVYPPIERLYVRFLYQNPNYTSPTWSPSSINDDYTAYPLPLLTNGGVDSTAVSVPFRHFSDTMSAVGVANASAWCNVCESTESVLFCKGAVDEPVAAKQTNRLMAAMLGSAGTLFVVAFVGLFA